MISTRRLTRTYKKSGRGSGPVHAVDGIDLEVQAGELVGFLGPNGAGKSTTLRLLATLLRPTAGQATVAGHDLLRDPAEVRRRIGYVAQAGGTAPETTVMEELLVQGRLHGMSRTSAQRRGAALMEQLQLTELAHRRTGTLSGGQRRRVDLALGLVHAPSLLLLDEPTTGLDPQSRLSLWEVLRTMHAERGITLLLSTHYLDEADELADRLVIVDQGRIVAEGSPDTLKSAVSGDSVVVGVAADAVARVAALVSRFPGAGQITTSETAVRFRVPKGEEVLPHLMRALQSAGISAHSLQVQRPTLDDVFLSFTGRSLKEA
ncbi:ATP-binding cassette domain-containing protein [Streptomyces sp. NPDC001858]